MQQDCGSEQLRDSYIISAVAGSWITLLKSSVGRGSSGSKSVYMYVCDASGVGSLLLHIVKEGFGKFEGLHNCAMFGNYSYAHPAHGGQLTYLAHLK